MKKYIKLVTSLAVLLLFVFTATAQYNSGRNNNRNNNKQYDDDRYDNNRYGNSYNWMSIARSRVTKNRGYEKITLNRRQRDVRQLMFRTNGDVNVYRVVIRYRNGRTEQVNVRNGRYNNRYDNEQIINIPRYRYDVHQITVLYNTSRYARGKSVINVYGR
ncbi:MAG: hypothetical protein ACK5NK_08920 [Niabella sp.]